MNSKIIEIKKFWDDQAKKYGQSSEATTPDIIAFEMEIEQLLKLIPNGSKILDVGCGNGVKGVSLAQNISCNYIGVDYSEEMIKQANSLKQKNQKCLKGNIEFMTGDVLNENILLERDFDFIISVRCLINLGSLDNQALAIKNLWPLLKKDGTLLLFENSVQPLKNINEVRRMFELPDIEVRWHNEYIDESKLFSAIEKYFKLVDTVQYKSTYFLISRTLNALLNVENGKIDYLSKLNHLASKLPPHGDYSPEKLFILKKLS
jgi:SAM-dependent methyltransferase